MDEEHLTQLSVAGFPLQICSFFCPDLAHQYSVISPLKTPSEPLCWSIALLEVLESTCGTCFPLSFPLDTRKLRRLLHWSPHPKTSAIHHHIYNIHRNLASCNTVSLLMVRFSSILSLRLSWRFHTCRGGQLRNHRQMRRQVCQKEADYCTILFTGTLHLFHFVPNTIHWLATTQVANTGIFCPRAS